MIWPDLAAQRLSAVLDRAAATGDYRWNNGKRQFNLGLFRGLAGVGYTLLRRARCRASQRLSLGIATKADRAIQTEPACRSSLSAHLLNNPMISALARVLKCRLKPTTAADVSAFTSSLSAFTANTVNR